MAKKSSGVLGRLLSAILIVIVLAIIVLGTLELFIEPNAAAIEAKFKNDDKVSTVTLSGTLVLVKPGQAAAIAALYLYGYSNTSITDKVDTVVTINYKETKDGEDKSYEAIVIYFDSISDANTARKGIKAKAKEDDKVTMVRGKTLVLGDSKAVMRYYYVIH